MIAAFAVSSEIAEDIPPSPLHHQHFRRVRVQRSRWQFVDEFLQSRLDARYRDEQAVAARSLELPPHWYNVLAGSETRLFEKVGFLAVMVLVDDWAKPTLREHKRRSLL
jgi:hypothetical protein